MYLKCLEGKVSWAGAGHTVFAFTFLRDGWGFVDQSSPSAFVSQNRHASHIDSGRSRFSKLRNMQQLRVTQVLLSSNVMTSFMWAGKD